MRVTLLSAMLLWQLVGVPVVYGADGEPVHYERNVGLPAGASGQACAVLDGAVFAHAAHASASDLRLYESGPGASNLEVPFAMTVSAAQPVETQTATVEHATVSNGRLVFDLAMPPRAYTDVNLQIDAKNFLGAAEVWGSEGARPVKMLGTYPIFDLSGQGLARSTVLPLPESSFPALHIELQLMDSEGHALASVSPAMITGAGVPPSRSAQTLYTTVATSPAMEAQGQWSLTTLTVPAHLPLERVHFVLDPTYTHSFSREVTIAATPIGTGYDAVGVAESLPGEIFRVDRPLPDGMPAIHTQQLSVDTLLGSNLRDSAKVLATVQNGAEPPLPITAVELQMRQRRLCFQATPGESYVIRYGDPSLRPPVYAYARSFVASATPIDAVLGPERVNAHFVPRRQDDSNSLRSQTPWIVLVAVIMISGVVGLQSMRRKEDEGQ